DARDLSRLTENLGGHCESAGVAAQIQHPAAFAEAGEHPAVVALIGEKAGLVLAARRHSKPHAVFANQCWRRRFRGMAIKRLLLLDMLFREPIERRTWEFSMECSVNGFP